MWPQISQSAVMRRDDICLYVSPANRSRLEAIVADRNSSSKAVWRAKIVLATADGLGTNAIMRRTGKSKPCVWRWQERYIMEGVDGLLRDKSRPPGKKPLSAAIKRKVLAKTASQTPPAATHWSVRTMAAEMGISHTSVQRIWAEAGLKPHRVRTFKISNDPQFEEKVSDVVGLYMNPPDKALVLCVDEKSQIQALDRTQPGLPLKKGRAATMTHDYKRHGTTTLYAALDVRSGLVIGDCQPRHRAREFIRFLKLIDRIVDKHFDLHLVVDNYGTHKTPARRQSSVRPGGPSTDHAKVAFVAANFPRSFHIKNLENVKKPRPTACASTSQRRLRSIAAITLRRYSEAVHSSPSGKSGSVTPNAGWCGSHRSRRDGPRPRSPARDA